MLLTAKYIPKSQLGLKVSFAFRLMHKHQSIHKKKRNQVVLLTPVKKMGMTALGPSSLYLSKQRTSLHRQDSSYNATTTDFPPLRVQEHQLPWWPGVWPLWGSTQLPFHWRWASPRLVFIAWRLFCGFNYHPKGRKCVSLMTKVKPQLCWLKTTEANGSLQKKKKSDPKL